MVRPHDLPVAVGLAADHDDVDVLLLEEADQLVGLGLELGRQRLLPERRARVAVVLHELQVPVARGRHLGRLPQPADQLLLGVEAAAVDELARGDRIEQQRRRRDLVGAEQHVAHVLAPVGLAQAEAERRRPAAEKHADDAVLRP